MELIGLKGIQTKHVGESPSLNSIVNNQRKDCVDFSRGSTATRAIPTLSLRTSVQPLSSMAGLFRQWDGTTGR